MTDPRDPSLPGCRGRSSDKLNPVCLPMSAVSLRKVFEIAPEGSKLKVWMPASAQRGTCYRKVAPRDKGLRRAFLSPRPPSALITRAPEGLPLPPAALRPHNKGSGGPSSPPGRPSPSKQGLRRAFLSPRPPSALITRAPEGLPLPPAALRPQNKGSGGPSSPPGRPPPS
ncbi:nascent polypeptide-associated complex subunit alpha, muscle-specific form-like [Penaeus chinensis]|uniref:nascent polypeptide-associated complex subunit alpha, muscle-specific form-like n=1 Tax=Penaeus chinensis TaxID=139456 RepID=UPI001FB6C8EC|nr:nascent polypeptide-associated complex subunit alpha, muscle-specific form-like [Penaeus chinensis]